jgi:plasmid stabilization system protein ParE
MKARVVWADPVRDLALELPLREQQDIFEKVALLKRLPHMYPLRTRGRFRRHRFFQGGNWLVFYKVVQGIIYIRSLWPARIP